jgi:hypothetical protein
MVQSLEQFTPEQDRLLPQSAVHIIRPDISAYLNDLPPNVDKEALRSAITAKIDVGSALFRSVGVRDILSQINHDAYRGKGNLVDEVDLSPFVDESGQLGILSQATFSLVTKVTEGSDVNLFSYIGIGGIDNNNLGVFCVSSYVEPMRGRATRQLFLNTAVQNSFAKIGSARLQEGKLKLRAVVDGVYLEDEDAIDVLQEESRKKLEYRIQASLPQENTIFQA